MLFRSRRKSLSLPARYLLQGVPKGQPAVDERLKWVGISQYTKSGVAPSRNTARGETAIGIGFLHDYALEKQQGAPLDSLLLRVSAKRLITLSALSSALFELVDFFIIMC